MNDILNEESAYQSKIKPRSPLIAFLFSLVLPGLGQVYNGQFIKGILFFGLLLLNPFLFGITRGATSFYGFILVCLIALIIRIYVVIDAVRIAKQKQLYVPQKWDSWYYQLSIAVVLVAIMLAFDTKAILGIQSFKIPTASNEPTIKTGDKIMADMQAYKNGQPNYGDIVVYEKENGQIYTFRIAGLPNDTLELNDDILKVNGKPSKSTFIKDTTAADDFEVSEFEEEFPNGQKHRIYKMKHRFDTTKSTIKNIIVPANSYYVLGDNRDNASDSRYEGFVESNKIYGRLVYSYLGASIDKINVDFKNK